MFRTINSIYLDDKSGYFSVNISCGSNCVKRACVETLLVDALCQTVLAKRKKNTNNYVLIEIGNVYISENDWSKTDKYYVVTTNWDDKDGKISADAYVKEVSGKIVAKLDHIVFLYNENVAEYKMVVASNFNVQPLENVLKFWNDKFNTNLNIQMDIYDQVFRLLLDKESMFYDEKSAINILVIHMEEWLRYDKTTPNYINSNRLDFKELNTTILPNNMKIAHINQYETNYVYDEIFEKELYLRNGIALKENAVVVDIGANIGLFSLYVSSVCPSSRVYSFEPSQSVYKALEVNIDAYAPNVTVENCGISDCAKVINFTFYEKSTVFSGVYPNTQYEEKAIKTIIKNVIKHGNCSVNDIDAFVDELAEERLNSKVYQVSMKPLSQVIREHSIKTIDLLKIDAEKSEVDIINGIEEDDWDKIKQIVMEIHETDEVRLDSILAILERHGFKCHIEQDDFLDNVKMYNLYAIKDGYDVEDYEGKDIQNFNQSIEMFCKALETYNQQLSKALLICFTNPSPDLIKNKKAFRAVSLAQKKIAGYLDSYSNCYMCEGSEIFDMYPMEHYYDYETKKLGHIPYTQEYYTVLGTIIFRKYMSVFNTSYKVLILDCDNTLWKGNCGEGEIQFTRPYQLIQEYALALKKRGVLLCMCSKNNEEDVWCVFEMHKEFILGKLDFVAYKINWKNKAENILELSKELNLDVSSFVFMDDSEFECSEVQNRFPNVLTICINNQLENIEQLLHNIWVFDNMKNTKEDAVRTLWYQNQGERSVIKTQSLTMKDFLDQLKLKVNITPIIEKYIPRASQLSYRTNQFNFTVIRRSEAQVRHFLKNNENHCLLTRVEDRFGDYGLVGCVMYTQKKNCYDVDSFMLSCRALGRGVEYQMLWDLLYRARNEHIEYLRLHYVKANKNQLAHMFLEKLFESYACETEHDVIYMVPVKNFINVDYIKYLLTENDDVIKETSVDMASAVVEQNSVVPVYKDIAQKYNTIMRLHEYVSDMHDEQHIDIEHGETENLLREIWSKILKVNSVDVNEKYEALGGDSLSAVFIVSEVNRALDMNLTISDLYDFPTIRVFAEEIDRLKCNI